jgi:MFS transporter, FHS family, L-fucose permease
MAIQVAPDAPGSGGGLEKTNVGALAIVTTLFFMWGFLTCLNDILIPHLKAIFELSYTQVLLVQFAFFTSYAVFAFPSGKVIEWIGYKRSMVLGLLTMGTGALLFVPAANLPSFPAFLTALIILAAGMTILQVSANPYVAVLGPSRTASSRLNLTQAFNSLGTTIAPQFGSMLILGAAALLTTEQMHQLSDAQLHAYRLQQAASVKVPYIGLGLALIALAAVIGMFRLPTIPGVERDIHSESHASIWRYRHLMLGALGIFVYVGAEVSIGSFLVNYLNLSNIANLPLAEGAKYVSYYWGGAMTGRFIGSILLQKFRAGKMLSIAATMAFLLVITTMLTSGQVAMWSVLAIGLFNSIMFPSIFTLGIDGLGPMTGEGSGILVAAIVGGAIIPELQGYIADRIGIHHAFFVPAICYLYILYYGIWGSRKKAASGTIPANAA